MRNKGFTLIELVIVIVILGILAATAAPRFIDLTGDARESVVKGVEGSINSAADIVHAKALIENETGATGSITVGTTVIDLVNGWPAATATGIGAALELSANSDIDVTTTHADDAQGTQNEYSWEHTGAPGTDGASDGKCTVTYAEAADSESRPVVVSTTTNC